MKLKIVFQRKVFLSRGRLRDCFPYFTKIRILFFRRKTRLGYVKFVYIFLTKMLQKIQTFQDKPFEISRQKYFLNTKKLRFLSTTVSTQYKPYEQQLCNGKQFERKSQEPQQFRHLQDRYEQAYSRSKIELLPQCDFWEIQQNKKTVSFLARKFKFFQVASLVYFRLEIDFIICDDFQDKLRFHS